MTERIDHAEKAREWIGHRNVPSYGGSQHQVAVAQVHATLALVEQQRIANLIALSEPRELPGGGEVSYNIWQFKEEDGQIKAWGLLPDVAAALGTEVENNE